MTIIIIGFGSIGQRHYKNLKNMGYENISIFDVDNKKTAGQDIKIVSDLRAEVLKEFDVALICNPNHLHIKVAIECAKAGCHLFIEKPLSHNLDQIEELISICDDKKLISLIGCNMRFHPCLAHIKDYVSSGKLGKVYSISHEFGYYLPYWRPDSDYRQNYAAKVETGGGIILDDIHEFDLLFWLNDFNEVQDSKFIYDKVSNLEIATEDICLATFKFKNNVLGLVRCDYLQQNYWRNCKIVGANGNLYWEFNENIVWLTGVSGKTKLFEVKDFDFNQVYIDELKYFFGCISNNKKTFNSIELSFGLLRYCVNKNG